MVCKIINCKNLLGISCKNLIDHALKLYTFIKEIFLYKPTTTNSSRLIFSIQNLVPSINFNKSSMNLSAG